MIFTQVPSIWIRPLGEGENGPPPETFYILAENGDYITDESGNRLIQEIAP